MDLKKSKNNSSGKMNNKTIKDLEQENQFLENENAQGQ